MTPPPPISTSDLLAQAGWVRSLARRLARDAASADDLAQGALGAALARPPRRGRPLRPWLARVLANLARKERGREARRAQRECAVARPEAEPASDQLLIELEEQQRLASLVAELPEPLRSVVLRRFYRGESAAAIARERGLPAATVRSQLARGLARLRDQVERRCDGNRQQALGVLVLAAGGHDGFLTSTLLSTTQLLAMNTGTKLAALTVTAAALCAGTVLLLSMPGSDVHPARGELAAAPTPPASEPAAQAEATESDPEQPQRVALEGARDGTDASVEDAPSADAPAPHVLFLRAVDERGIPIAGAQLVPVSEPGLPRDMLPSAPSAADGRIEFEIDRKACFQYVGRETANAYLCVRAPGYAGTFFVGIVTLQGRHDQGDRVLTPGGAVSGLVLDANGIVVEGATLVASSALVDADPDALRLAGPETEGGRPSALSDAAGRFEIEGVRVGSTRVWARAKGTQWSFSAPLDVRAHDQVRGVELTLEPVPDDARIAGRVVDPTGLSVEGAQITYRSPRTYDELKLLSDAAGGFSIDLEARADHVLTTHDPRERFGPARPRIVAAGETDVLLELTPRRLLTVRAEDPDGRPLEGVAVLAVVVDSHDDYMNQEWRHTDAEGRVRVPARGATFEVSLSEAGYESLKLGPFDPDALPEGDLVGRLELEPAIRGVVLHEGRPVQGAAVELVQTFPGDSREINKGFPSRFWGSGSLDDVRTDAEGRFSVANSGKATMESVLLVEKQGLALAQHEFGNLAEGDVPEPIEVQLFVGGTLEGHVLVPPSRSRSGVVVGASRGDGRPRFTRTNAQGRYRFEHLTPGPWRVEDRPHEPEGRVMSLRPAAEAPYDWNCEVREGETTQFVVDLRWQEDLRVHGRLLLDGAGAAGWSAVLEAPMSADREFDLRPAQLDEQGRFAAQALPGSATLVLRSPADETPARVLFSKLRVNQELQPLELELGTGSLAGRLEGGSARLRLVHRIDPLTHLELEFSSDDEGAFEIIGVPAGEVGLQREQRGNYGLGWYPVETVEVVAGQTTTVE